MKKLETVIVPSLNEFQLRFKGDDVVVLAASLSQVELTETKLLVDAMIEYNPKASKVAILKALDTLIWHDRTKGEL